MLVILNKTSEYGNSGFFPILYTKRLINNEHNQALQPNEEWLELIF